MKVRIILFLILTLLTRMNSIAQWVLINDTGGIPDSSAALEISAIDRGIVIPKMTFVQREAITSPAESLLIYQTDSTYGLYFYSGTEWVIVGKNKISNNEIDSKIAVVRDIKASGVNGGTFSAGSWETRDLNDLRGDSSFITIDGVNTFTLDSGLYEISAAAPARGVNEHQIRLYNVTDAAMEATGVAVRSEIADPPSKLVSVIKINSLKVFRIEHRCTITSASSDAKGTGINWGENIYTQVRIQKL